MELNTQVHAALPFLDEAPDSFVEELTQNAIAKNFEAGEAIMHEKDQCDYLPIVLAGSIRVYKVSEAGREITLYHIGMGQTCFLSVNCIFMSQNFPVEARADEYTEALMVPAHIMQRWMHDYEFWRRYVFEMAAQRLLTVITSLSEMAFLSMDVRIAEALRNKLEKSGSNRLEITHQELATELGTAREVVSRTLKTLEKQGAVNLGRGYIEVEDSNKLPQAVL